MSQAFLQDPAVLQKSLPNVYGAEGCDLSSNGLLSKVMVTVSVSSDKTQ